MKWKSHLLWLATFLLFLVLVRSGEEPSTTTARSVPKPRAPRSNGANLAVAELEIGPHDNPSALLKIFSHDTPRARSPLAPAMTLELKGMRLLLRTNSPRTTKKAE